MVGMKKKRNTCCRKKNEGQKRKLHLTIPVSNGDERGWVVVGGIVAGSVGIGGIVVGQKSFQKYEAIPIPANTWWKKWKRQRGNWTRWPQRKEKKDGWMSEWSN